MNTPNERDRQDGTHPLEQVTGERDVHPEEDDSRPETAPSPEEDGDDAGGDAP